MNRSKGSENYRKDSTEKKKRKGMSKVEEKKRGYNGLGVRWGEESKASQRVGR